MMKTLLIGGNRFVGVEILWHLLAAGHTLTVLALDSPPADARPHIRWLQVDRNDVAALTALLAHEYFDCVVDNIAYEPLHVERMLTALSGRIGRYLLTSTADCYPENFPRSYKEDQVEIRAYDLTGLTGGARYNYGKRSCEAALKNSGVPWTVLRPVLVTGPRDNCNGAPHGRQLHWFEESARSHFWASRVLDGGPLLLCSGDETVFKLVWVGDLARAVTHLLSISQSMGQAYTLTGDEIWTNERIVRALSAAAGVNAQIVHIPNPLLEQAGLDYAPVYGTSTAWTLPDNSKLKSTGWHPTPAEQWMPLLLEANSKPDMRTWYHTRLQEIALARHVQRAMHWQAPLALTAGIAPVQPPLHAKGCTISLPGRLCSAASWALKTRAMQQTQGSTPRESFYGVLGEGVISRIGLGTWMGDLSGATDQRYIDTLVHAASRGVNVFDTAINYRHMKAERCVGAAVQRLSELGIARDALCISSKGGYITHDADDRRNAPTYLRETYLLTGLIDEGELSRTHSINPAFIAHQIKQSLENLGLQTIDLYYLHNPEDEIVHLGVDAFYARLTDTFEVLEKAVAAGQIAHYGIATWLGLRVPVSDPGHLSLERVLVCAHEAAMRMGLLKSHLQAVQLPFNVREHQAHTLPTQRVHHQLVSALEAITAFGLYAFTSASVIQGNAVPEKFKKTMPGYSMHTAALRVVCSTPGVGTALVGMRRIASVEEALAVGAQPAYPVTNNTFD